MSQEDMIQQFWEAHPCGENLVPRDEDWALFFEQYDRFRYGTEGHILGELDAIGLDGKKVLEIGIGQAADSLQIAKRGGRWSGLDLTDAAILRAKTRFKLAGMAFDEAKQGSVLHIPYDDDSFDIVYSHGVLHHVPEIKAGSEEIWRVLKPDGKLVVMFYHKNSLNYWLSIFLLRRVMMLGLWLLARLGLGKRIASPTLQGHIENANAEGLLNYLRMPRFMWANTDGPKSPYSKVYTLKEAREDFPRFDVLDCRCHFLNDRHIPLLKLLPSGIRRWLEGRYGWHLWVVMKPKPAKD